MRDRVKIMTKIIVDLQEESIQALDSLKTIMGISRVELIRQAVSYFLINNVLDDRESFGLWKNKIDGLAYQNKLREEWE